MWTDWFPSELDSVISRASRPGDTRLHPMSPFAVIAMGKWGARELNYYSDIDRRLRTRVSVEDKDTESRTSRPGDSQPSDVGLVLSHFRWA